jgi:hypothetical protein
VFSASTYAIAANVRKFTVTYKGLSQDQSNNNVDGIELYGWDGVNWVLLDRSRTPDKQTLTFSTSKPEIAQQFVVSSLIRLLAKTRATKDTTGNLDLRTHYVDCVVNEDLSTDVPLLNKAVLDSGGAVVSVKNLTQDTTLALGTDYTISDDRLAVKTIGQAEGDVIEVKYNQYYHLVLDTLTEQPFSGDVSLPTRSVQVHLRTLTPIEKI